MSDYAQTSAATRNAGIRAESAVGRTVRGSEAGQDAKYNERAEQEDWDAYKREKRLSFAASKAQHATPFAEWRRARRPKPTPSPSPTPTPSAGSFTERLATEVMGARRP